MAKFLDPSDFEPIAPLSPDAQPDAIETAPGLTEDATQDNRPSIDSPVSIAEAARLLNANADTVRKRWMPRVLDAVKATAIETDVMVTVGQTKAGNPIQRLSPKGFELLADFQTVAGDVEAIAAWVAAIQSLYAVDEPAPQTEAIEPEIEPIAQPWESAGALAIVPNQSAAIAVDADWTGAIDEQLEADWQGISQAQLDIATTLNTGGAGLSEAMRRLARSHLAAAGAAYQQELSQGLKAIASGNLQAVMGTGQAPPSARSSAA